MEGHSSFSQNSGALETVDILHSESLKLDLQIHAFAAHTRLNLSVTTTRWWVENVTLKGSPSTHHREIHDTGLEPGRRLSRELE